MFVFNIDDVLDEIKDLSAQEKIKVLDEAYEELEAAMEELVSTKEEIEDQYEREVQQKVNEAVKKHIKERGIQHAVKIENGMIECDYKDFGVCIFTQCLQCRMDVVNRFDAYSAPLAVRRNCRNYRRTL